MKDSTYSIIDNSLIACGVGLLVGLGFIAIVGIMLAHNNDKPYRRCQSLGGEYSYAAGVCFKDGEEV